MSHFAIYIVLLLAGLACLIAHYVAPFRVARRIREKHPQHWQIIDDRGQAHGMRLWMRMQHVLRSPAIPALGDVVVERWWRTWRYSQWLAWACWLVALGLQWVLRG